MKNRVDIAAIAAALKVSKRAAEQRAAREAWPFDEHTARGGRKRFYDIARLPSDVQAALAEKIVSAAPASAASPIAPSSLSRSATDAGALFSSTRGSGRGEGAARQAEPGSSPGPRSLDDARAESLAMHFEHKPESVKSIARERLAIVQEYFTLLSRGFERGAVVAAVTRERGISEATLARHLGLVRGKDEHLWLYELCPAYAGRKAMVEIPAEALEALKADYLRPERPAARACIARLQRVAAEKGWTLPSTRTLLRRLERLPRAIKVMKREGMKAAKALYPAQVRDKTALHALAIVNGDGYKHNLWVRFPDGQVLRPKTWFWQDVYSSKILTWYTAPTEHTESIQFSFGDLCERFGIPGSVTIDNTMAAANKTMSGGIRHRYRFKVREDEPDGVFKLLGVQLHWTTPGHGQAKPVERINGIGGVGEYIDKATDLAGAWTGGSPLDKPEYDGKHRAIELAELEAVIAREVAFLNARQGRRSALHQGRSFDDVFNESYARVEIRKATDAQRRLWLLSTEPVRAASRDGAITLDAGRVRGERQANRYWHSELVDYAGKPVVAKFDPRRLHEGIHVYSNDGRWICYAPCERAAGFNDQAAAREHARARNTFLRATKQLGAAEVRMSALQAAKSLSLGASSGTAATIPAPKVVRGIFADPLARPGYVPAERSAEEKAAERAELEQLERDMAEASAAAPVNVLELRSDADKHAHWKALDARRAEGEQLADAEEAFWNHWQTQDYYRDAVDAEAEFEQALSAREASA